MLSRRDAVYARPQADFSRCGIINAGYIHRVRLAGTPQRHDLNWLRPLQMALLKEKYPKKFKHYPDWTGALAEECCTGYWWGVLCSSARSCALIALTAGGDLRPQGAYS